MQVLWSRSILLFFVLVLAITGIGGWYVVSALRSVEAELPVTSLEEQRALSGLIQGLARVTTRLDAARLEPSLVRVDQATIALDRAFAIVTGFQQRFAETAAEETAASVEEVHRLLDAADALLQGDGGLDATAAVRLLGRLGEAQAALLDVYLISNTQALVALDRQSQQIGQLQIALILVFGLVLVAVAAMIALIVLQLRTASLRDAARAALADSEQRYRDLIEGSVQGILITDDDGRPVLANQAFAAIHGYAGVEEILEMPTAEPLWAPDERDRLRAYRATRGSGRDAPERYEYCGLRKDGEAIWLEDHVRRIVWQGRPASQSTVIDITKRRQMQRELEAAIESTTKAYRELRETQDQLVQSEKMAALGALVAGIAHEINTPIGITLTAATTLADRTHALRQRADEGKAKKSEVMRYFQLADETVGLMVHHSNRAADLIHSFKQVSVDQTSDQRRRFRLCAYLEEVILSLAPALRKTPHEVIVNCPESLEVDSYPGAYSQVVTNFLVNAITHGYDGTTAGKLRLTVEPGTDGWLDLRFSDDGNGVPLELQDRLFDPFFTTRRGSGGSGLGLHIVHNLVVGRLGGEVRYEDTPGGGATFVMRVPIAAPEQGRDKGAVGNGDKRQSA